MLQFLSHCWEKRTVVKCLGRRAHVGLVPGYCPSWWSGVIPHPQSRSWGECWCTSRSPYSGWGPSPCQLSQSRNSFTGSGPHQGDRQTGHHKDGVWGVAPASCPAAGRMAPGLMLWPLAGLSPSVQALSLSITPAQTAAWRKQIFQQLTERTKRELESFRHYEQAVEQVGPPARLFVCLFGRFSLFSRMLALNSLIAQVSLTLIIQLLQPPECWGHRHSAFQLAPARLVMALHLPALAPTGSTGLPD